MSTEAATGPETTAEITVYWRPGCGFCSALLRQFQQLNIPHALVNIWDDPSGAQFVRGVARGSETVPTVAVGPVALVNPTARDVLEAALIHAPAAVPLGFKSRAR